MPPTRVFISCGQRAGTDEPAIAEGLAAALEGLGFEPYVAIGQQSLRAIRENVFPALRDAEYFIFIDFRRELLAPPEVEFRGSLFSHQELAIASYLEKDVIVFQESGVRQLDGLMGHLQANARQFSDRSTLVTSIVAEVTKRQWAADWRNALRLELDTPHFDDSPVGAPNGPPGRFFHLRVHNDHRSLVATDCYAFLYSARRLSDGVRETFGTAEFKWAGTTLPAVSIGPRGFRVLDAFWLDHRRPQRPLFNCFADSGRYLPQFEGPGQWILEFGVVSHALPSVTRAFKMTLGTAIASASLAAL